MRSISGLRDRRSRLAVVMVPLAFLGIALSAAQAGYPAPRGYQAVGYSPEGLAGRGYGHGSVYAWPYHTKSHLYAYPDFAYGRGPLINLGGAALQPGFRGYGVVGSPGYGLGMYPSTWNDQRPSHGHGKFFGFGIPRGQ